MFEDWSWVLPALISGGALTPVTAAVTWWLTTRKEAENKTHAHAIQLKGHTERLARHENDIKEIRDDIRSIHRSLTAGPHEVSVIADSP